MSETNTHTHRDTLYSPSVVVVFPLKKRKFETHIFSQYHFLCILPVCVCVTHWKLGVRNHKKKWSQRRKKFYLKKTRRRYNKSTPILPPPCDFVHSSVPFFALIRLQFFGCCVTTTTRNFKRSKSKKKKKKGVAQWTHTKKRKEITTTYNTRRTPYTTDRI